jgi:chemotaxis protein CheX
MTTAATTVRLPVALDLGSAAPLAAELLGLRGGPIRLDASGVDRLGGLGLQLLLSAQLTWRNDGAEFALVDPSDAFRADWAALGGAPGDLNEAPHG